MTKQQAENFVRNLERFIEAKENYMRTVAIEDTVMLNDVREVFTESVQSVTTLDDLTEQLKKAARK